MPDHSSLRAPVATPIAGGDDVVALDASPTSDNLAAMRGEIARVLAGSDEEFVQDVQLVATELAANACDHAAAPRHLLLRRERAGGGSILVVEVRDGTPDRLPLVGRSTLGEHRGNGMRMVLTLCQDWGVRRMAEAKVVWARLPFPGLAPALVG
ncbi:ATP-binding protein [Saccharothrix longispora]|uniref:Anti-sigma regulatory factor (Ser/Thr protein kinase) n=1 Tax=Saccharothrix longispora TaxID=33920 RepID=A0ABU1PQU5_9PSEU|nr:ATP-binding protein [Saccharothrix longispora]MDR6593026.1 anti-sigma regulatory factor (Ser/Thr protein kinase) [Saccharothrix longispora]